MPPTMLPSQQWIWQERRLGRRSGGASDRPGLHRRPGGRAVPARPGQRRRKPEVRPRRVGTERRRHADHRRPDDHPGRAGRHVRHPHRRPPRRTLRRRRHRKLVWRRRIARPAPPAHRGCRIGGVRRPEVCSPPAPTRTPRSGPWIGWRPRSLRRPPCPRAGPRAEQLRGQGGYNDADAGAIMQAVQAARAIPGPYASPIKGALLKHVDGPMTLGQADPAEALTAAAADIDELLGARRRGGAGPDRRRGHPDRHQ